MRIRHDYNFTPSLQLSICQNAQKVLREMQQSEYFAKVNNLTFHDLTTGNILPESANLLLGLGLKFIPTQKHNITQMDLDTTVSRCDRDIGLKTYFSGAPMDSYDPSLNALRVKSIWRAPLPPQEIDTRIERFSRAIRNSFTPISVKHHNLSKTEQIMLKEIRRNPDITITGANKNFGPVGVNTSQYTEWGMKHLSDESTYNILTKEEASEAAKTLSKEIFD